MASCASNRNAVGAVRTDLHFKYTLIRTDVDKIFASKGVSFLLRIEKVPGSSVSKILSHGTETIPVFRYVPLQTNDTIGTHYLITRYKEIIFVGTFRIFL